MKKIEGEGEQEKLNKLIEINTAIRDLLILIAYQTNAPLRNIAKAAGMRHSKLYKIIPKGKKRTNRKNSNEDTD